jgi:hypothetical protein
MTIFLFLLPWFVQYVFGQRPFLLHTLKYVFVIKRIHIEILAFIVTNMVFYNTNKINYVNCNDYANGITSTIMLKLNHPHITYTCHDTCHRCWKGNVPKNELEVGLAYLCNTFLFNRSIPFKDFSSMGSNLSTLVRLQNTLA